MVGETAQDAAAAPGASAGASGAPAETGAPEPRTEAAPGEPQPRSVIDASLDLVQTSVAYVRQEIGAAVRDKAVVPVQQTAIDVAVLLAMAISLAFGVLFIAVGLLLVFAGLIGWPATMFLIGGLMIVISIGVIMVVRGRLEARRREL